LSSPALCRCRLDRLRGALVADAYTVETLDHRPYLGPHPAAEGAARDLPLGPILGTHRGDLGCGLFNAVLADPLEPAVRHDEAVCGWQIAAQAATLPVDLALGLPLGFLSCLFLAFPLPCVASAVPRCLIDAGQLTAALAGVKVQPLDGVQHPFGPRRTGTMRVVDPMRDALVDGRVIRLWLWLDSSAPPAH
jgi:hypothetical protein